MSYEQRHFTMLVKFVKIRFCQGNSLGFMARSGKIVIFSFKSVRLTRKNNYCIDI